MISQLYKFIFSSKKQVFLILLFLIPIFVFSQLTEKNKEVLREELARQVNDLRISKGLKPLLFNDTLKKAAEFHSEYMAKNNILSHEEKHAKYKTPKKRVNEFKGNDFEAIGENILYSSPQNFPLKKKDLIQLANDMFTSWKNSPTHYANMIEVEYSFGDFGFKANTKKGIVYATQVFASKGIQISNQITQNAFEIVPASKNCDQAFEQYSNLILNMGNDMQIEDNEVVLYYHDMQSFKKIFTSPNDGIAVDLVSKNQLACGSPNQLDFSPIYDGIMLKPFFASEMLENNKAESNFRLITRVGVIPTNLVGKEFSPSMILIKNGKACKYVYPAFVPRQNYNLIPIEPIVNDEASITLTKKGVINSEILNYDFKTDKSSTIELPNITKSKNQIYSIQINSFSSVEGDSIHNNQLQNARADFIKNHLISKLGVSPNIFVINAKENWEQMNFQLSYFNRDSLVNLSHDSLKKVLVNRDNSLPWDSLLFSQRKATAIINYEGEFHENDSLESLTDFNLRTAIVSGNVALANKALYEMYKSSNYEWSILFEPQIIDFIKSQPKVVTNYAALLSLNYAYDPYFVTDFIHSWMNRSDQLDMNARNNLLHLYTLIGTYLLDNWDVSSEQLSNVIHPNKIEKMSLENISSELVLNLHLTFIQYFGQINDKPNISKSFNFITRYFQNHSLKAEDDVALALFYNKWSMYNLTVQHLLAKFNDGKINEDGIFTLAQTMNFTNYNDYSGKYIEVQEKARSINQIRWCEWLKNDFQVLRNYEIKRLYCESCE